MTEASSFHLLLCPPKISRTLLVLVSYGVPVSVVLYLWESPSHLIFCCLLLYLYPPLSVRFPSLLLPSSHEWPLVGGMDKHTAHSRWEQIANRPPKPGSHPRPDPQEMLNTLKAKRLQHGRQGSAFPGSVSEGERQCCSVIRGQRPHSCKL